MTHSEYEKELDQKDEGYWSDFQSEFHVRPGAVYLNHGSFGIALQCVLRRRDELLRSMESQPMDFYLRQYEPLLEESLQSLGKFLNSPIESLAYVDNATYAMNVVANSFEFSPGDEVLMTDQTYGAVRRIWQKKAQETGIRLVDVRLPDRIESRQQVVDLIVSALSSRTRMVVFSHIVSTSALVLPAGQICKELRSRGVLSCVDGPRAPLQIDLDLTDLDCDFYTASLHKWLCGPLGTGFLFVHANHHHQIDVPVIGWGRLLPAEATQWHHELIWIGTRNPTGALSIPLAIDFFNSLGVENVRRRMRYLAQTAEAKLTDLFGTQTIASRADGWYGSMAHAPLPVGDWSDLQEKLWREESIEVPVWELNGRWWIRVSCHIYNSLEQIDLLVRSLKSRL